MHCYVGERAMAHEHTLNFEACDILAAPTQIVRLAVDKVEIPLSVNSADVARVIPPVAARGHRRLGMAPVTLEHHMRPLRSEDDLAIGVGRKFVVSVIEDANVEVLVIGDSRGLGFVLDSGRLPRYEARFCHSIRTAKCRHTE